MAQLARVDLWSCETMQGSLSSFEGMAGLSELTLARCIYVTGDLSSLEGLPLIKLDLRGCKLITGGLQNVASAGLRELNLRSCEFVTGNIAALTRCTDLEKLVLTKCGLVEGEMAPLVTSCEKLSELKFDRCPKVKKTAGQVLLAAFDMS